MESIKGGSEYIIPDFSGEKINEARETIPTPYLDDFFDFITEESKNGKSRKEISYYGFYNGKERRPLYSEEWVDKNKAMYDRLVRDVIDQNSKEEKLSLYTHPQSGWVHAGSGPSQEENMGRLYLNYRPLAIRNIVEGILPKLREAGIPLSLKFARGLESSANRADKMVIYFNEADTAATLKALREVIDPEWLMDKIPYMTMPLTDSQGKVIPGFSFGEEPSNAIGSFEEVLARANGSFGELRARALAYLTERIASGNFSDSVWDETCKRYNINSKNPAFNLVPKKARNVLENK